MTPNTVLVQKITDELTALCQRRRDSGGTAPAGEEIASVVRRHLAAEPPIPATPPAR